jgi:hypothetical protein
VWRTVSVSAASCTDANIASTAAIIRGRAAPAWLTGLGLPARLVDEAGRVRTVGGWPPEGSRPPEDHQPAEAGHPPEDHRSREDDQPHEDHRHREVGQPRQDHRHRERGRPEATGDAP